MKLFISYGHDLHQDFVRRIDMSEYRDRLAEPAWYETKLKELLGRLRPDLAGGYRKELQALEMWPDPVPQQADIVRHLGGFVGREWLLDILEDWRLRRTGDRLFWLAGAPGTRMTAFSAWITAMHQANVVALNLCRWDLRERCNAARVVRTLAWFVARRAQDYRAQLLRLMRAMDRQDPQLEDYLGDAADLLVQACEEAE